jgi:glycosyltransferase involved in cell wall biosynthesis
VTKEVDADLHRMTSWTDPTVNLCNTWYQIKPLFRPAAHSLCMRIGIVMPAWNVAPWIGDAIASVVVQSHRDWTMVVVDDGSTDATEAVVAAFPDPRIRLVGQTNSGVSAARNRGMALLDTEALLFLDADDWLAPDALGRLAHALETSPRAVAASGTFTFASTAGPASRAHHPPCGDILAQLLIRNCFANGGHLLLRRPPVDVAGGFHTGITYGEDWEYWIRIALLGPFASDTARRSPLLFVRQRPGGAYHRLAADPTAFAPCMEAIFTNPALIARFGATQLSAIRRRTDAENAWIIGRELIRHDRATEGRSWLHRSIRAHPSTKRAILLAAAYALPILPLQLRGPFQPYRVTCRAWWHAHPPVSDC